MTDAIEKITKGQEVAADVAALLRARNPLIWIVTREEARVERLLIEAAAAAAYVPQTWDVAQGICDMSGKAINGNAKDPSDALDAIRTRAEGGNQRTLTIMRDLPAWISGPSGATTLRSLRNLARLLPGVPRDKAQAIIVLSPSGEVPPELSNHATVIEWPMPDREEIAAILDAAIRSLPDEAASEIDRATLRRIEEARTAFLDLDEGGKVARPVVEGRALDLAPSRSVRKASEATRIMEL